MIGSIWELANSRGAIGTKSIGSPFCLDLTAARR